MCKTIAGSYSSGFLLHVILTTKRFRNSEIPFNPCVVLQRSDSSSSICLHDILPSTESSFIIHLLISAYCLSLDAKDFELNAF